MKNNLIIFQVYNFLYTFRIIRIILKILENVILMHSMDKPIVFELIDTKIINLCEIKILVVRTWFRTFVGMCNIVLF
jgi:hypothetical protein